MAGQADIVILAIKPQMAAGVLSDLEPTIKADKLVISIMAGITTSCIEETLTSGVRVVRVMPNAAALIQAAASAICPGRKADVSDLATTTEIFSRVGAVVTTTEKLMDAVTGLSGSGPAYVFSFIEALSDAGVKNGLARDVSMKLAVQTMLGAARMVDETGEHPALLREKVTSPGGTTIAGLHTLENGRFHGLVMVVDGTGPDDDDQPAVLAVQHARQLQAAGLHQLLRGVGRGQPFLQDGGCDQGAHGLDAQVVDARGVVRAGRGDGPVDEGHGGPVVAPARRARPGAPAAGALLRAPVRQ